MCGRRRRRRRRLLELGGARDLDEGGRLSSSRARAVPLYGGRAHKVARGDQRRAQHPAGHLQRSQGAG